MINATSIVFDAFGTLLKIQNGTHPYRRLLKLGVAQGRRPRPDDSRQIMVNPWGLLETADAFGIHVLPEQMEELQSALDAEIMGIEAYQDGLEAVELLQSRGARVAVCSNLAHPYGAAVRRCFPSLDAYIFSFDVGAMKPDPAIYLAGCQGLDSNPAQVIMIGDSQACDRDGPKAIGMSGFYLDRTANNGDYSDLLGFARSLGF